MKMFNALRPPCGHQPVQSLVPLTGLFLGFHSKDVIAAAKMQQTGRRGWAGCSWLCSAGQDSSFILLLLKHGAGRRHILHLGAWAGPGTSALGAAHDPCMLPCISALTSDGGARRHLMGPRALKPPVTWEEVIAAGDTTFISFTSPFLPTRCQTPACNTKNQCYFGN